jgi:hypothetical protein
MSSGVWSGWSLHQAIVVDTMLNHSASNRDRSSVSAPDRISATPWAPMVLRAFWYSRAVAYAAEARGSVVS